jgi:hypothetical protein
MVNGSNSQELTLPCSNVENFNERSMTFLTLHNQKIETVFDLLGQKENDLTYALGWALARSPQFLMQLAITLGLKNGLSERVIIRLQEHSSTQGITDIEIDDPGQCHIILEAKRGFTVPSEAQLKKYANRLNAARDQPKTRLLVVLAEDDRENSWLKQRVPNNIDGVPVKTISWQNFIKLAKRIKSRDHAERHLLHQFIHYLRGATTMQNQNSNLVYVVALSNETFGCGDTTFIDVVEKYGRYFHPVGGVGGGWPYDPPNYLGFRYGSELKSIHHIESYDVISDYKPHFTDTSTPIDRPHFLYKLGPAIKPSRRVPTNGQDHTIYPSGRKWIYIDLLLTADSVAEAAYLTKKRDAELEQETPDAA